MIKLNSFSEVDIGKIETEGQIKPSYFINIADAGIGGEIIHRVNRSNKKMGGIIYTSQIIKGLLTFKRKIVSIKTEEGEIYTGKLLSFVIANGCYFANGLKIAPDAKVNNGTFAITLFGNISIIDYFKNIKKIKRGDKLSHKEVRYFNAKHVTINSIEKQYHIETDGEYIGHSPSTITILPATIQMLTGK